MIFLKQQWPLIRNTTGSHPIGLLPPRRIASYSRDALFFSLKHHVPPPSWTLVAMKAALSSYFFYTVVLRKHKKKKTLTKKGEASTWVEAWNGCHRGRTYGLEALRVRFNCRLDMIYNCLGGESNERLSSSSGPVGVSVEGYLDCVHWREKSLPTVGGATLWVEDSIEIEETKFMH